MMPVKYTRKTNNGNTSKEVLDVALKDIENGLSVRQTAKTHSIDRITLTRYGEKIAKGEFDGTSYAGTRKAKMVFPEKMEEDLAKHVTFLADSFYGLSKDKTLELAYYFTVQNQLVVPASWIARKRAGDEWFSGFRESHNTSTSRATGFNKTAVNRFFDELGELMDRNPATFVSLQQIILCPSYVRKTTNVGRKKRKAAIVTDTPEKEEIENEKIRRLQANKPQKKKSAPRPKLPSISSSDSNEPQPPVSDHSSDEISENEEESV